MSRSRALITAVFIASLAGAVTLASLNGREQRKEVALVEVDDEPTQPKKEPKVETKVEKPEFKPKGKSNKVVWETSFENAMQRARKEGKPILIDFYTDWCHWCKVMDKEVYPNKDVIAQSQNWIMVKVDGDKRSDVARAYGVSGFPTIVFAEGSGKPIEIVPGFAPAPEFVNIMQGAFSKWTPPTST